MSKNPRLRVLHFFAICSIALWLLNACTTYDFVQSHETITSKPSQKYSLPLLKSTKYFEKSALYKVFINLLDNDESECYFAIFYYGDQPYVIIQSAEYEYMTTNHPNRQRLLGGFVVQCENKRKLFFICFANNNVKESQVNKFFNKTTDNIKVKIKYKRLNEGVYFAASDYFIKEVYAINKNYLDTLYINHNGRILKSNF